jgi:hypothetical protein
LRTKFLPVLLTVICINAVADESLPVWSYTVKSGDNLINLAKVHLLRPADWKQVQLFNRIKNPHQIPVGTVLKVPLALVKRQPASAEIVAVSGVANLQKNEVITPLSLGQKLTVGTKLMTGSNSKVTIKFADGTLTQIASNSVLILDTMSLYSGGAMVDTRLRLQQGQVETLANPKAARGNAMQVITPTAIAAVRGTQFRVSAEGGSVTQETLLGQVAFEAASQTVAVHKGFGSIAEQGKAPIAPVPLLPAVDTSTMPSLIEHLPAQFTIPKLDGAAAWLGRVSIDAQQTNVSAEQQVQSNQLAFNALDDGDYYLTVRAKDVLGISGYDAQHRFTLNAQPFAPALIFPNNAAVIRDAQPELLWKPSQQAGIYVLQVAMDAQFKHLVFNQRTAQPVFRLDKPLQPGQYYWRVAAVSLSGAQEDQGPFTSYAMFNYAPLPPMPDISQLKALVRHNRVFVDTLQPLEGMTYQVRLANPYNHQETVWVGSGLSGQFDFDLREYGAQQLYIQHVDQQGAAGPAAFYEFNVSP